MNARGSMFGVRRNRAAFVLGIGVQYDRNEREIVVAIGVWLFSFYRAKPCEDCGRRVRGGWNWCAACLGITR